MPYTEAEIELRDLRNELEQNFKPIFEKHGGEGIGLADLQHELEDEGLLEHIRKSRMEQLLGNADRDSNKLITYNEFVRMMTEDLTKEERKPFRRIMRAAIADIIPRRQREDFLANYNCCPPPLFIPLISAAEIAVFIYYKFELEKRGIQTTATEGVDMTSPLVYTPRRRYEAWRFISYMFMHQGYMHIIFNMLFQILYGLTLEVVHKWWRVGIVYLLGVLAGGLAHSISDHQVGLVGASGGVYALLGAHFAAIVIVTIYVLTFITGAFICVKNWKEMNYKCLDPEEMEDNACCGICRVLLSAPVRMAIILILVVPDTSLAVYRRVTAPDENKIGVTAHIGGFLAGVMLGIVILRNINRLTWERTLGWVTLALYLAFVAFCCLFNAFYEGYPPTDWKGY